MEPTPSTYDVLLTAREPGTREAIAQALRDTLVARISYTRPRFDAVLCDSGPENPDCWCFLPMIRSGRFGGFPDTPAFVLASPEEHAALSALADDLTHVLDSYGDIKPMTLISKALSVYEVFTMRRRSALCIPMFSATSVPSLICAAVRPEIIDRDTGNGGASEFTGGFCTQRAYNIDVEDYQEL